MESISATTKHKFVGWFIVTAIAAFNMFNQLGSPNGPIWDENYYITSTARYETGTAQFASHPPLGLMFIAAGDYLYGANAKQDLKRIGADKKIAGEAMPGDYSYFGLRCASALAGTLAAGVFFLLMATLLGEVSLALLFSSFFLFDTALITQFRAAHLDSFQLLFVLLGILLLAKARDMGQGFLISSFAFGICVGLATMVRANGILLLATAPALCALPLFDAGRKIWARFNVGAASVALTLSGMLVAVILVMAVHVATSHSAPDLKTPAGEKDTEFLSAEHRGYLTSQHAITPGVFVAILTDYKRFIESDLRGVSKTDANGSTPIEWLTGQNPISYRWDSDGVRTSHVMLIANPIAWLVSILGLLFAIYQILRLLFVPSSTAPLREHVFTASMALFWMASMLAYHILAQQRVMYLYHYFIPLVTGWIVAADAWRSSKPRFDNVSWARRLLSATVFACIMAFVFLSPLALHKPLTKAEFDLRLTSNFTAR